MKLRITAAYLALTLCAIGSGQACAQTTDAGAAAAQVAQAEPDEAPEPGPAAALVPPDFAVPILVETPDFKIVPLGPAVVDVDFAAYMSSIEHLQKTFSRSTSWPREGISAEDAMLDMTTEQGRFERRASFAYSVLTPDGSRERGSLYVSPSPVGGYDAVVRMWVTKADYDAGFDAELYDWATHWIAQQWPFEKVAWPGRAIGWDAWDAMVAHNGSH